MHRPRQSDSHCHPTRSPEDVSWYNGPPYAVAETVFDEYDLGGCQLDPADT